MSVVIRMSDARLPDTKEIGRRVADKLRRDHPDFDWQKLARTLLPLYEARAQRVARNRR